MRGKEYTEREIEELIDNISYFREIKAYIPNRVSVITEEKKNIIEQCFNKGLTAFECAVIISNAFLDQF